MKNADGQSKRPEPAPGNPGRPSPSSGPPPQPVPGPTRDDRQRLLSRLRAQATNEPDPMSASLQMINADMILLAYAIVSPLAELAKNPSADNLQSFSHYSTPYLRLVGQIARLAQNERQWQNRE